MRYWRSLFLPSMLVATLFLQGCWLFLVGAGAAAGAGAVAYVEGELRSTEPVLIDEAYEASQQALRDLELPINESKVDALSGEVTSRTVDDKPIRITLKRTENNNTQIGIRVGAFGEEVKSRQILEAIRRNLKKGAAI